MPALTTNAFGQNIATVVSNEAYWTPQRALGVTGDYNYSGLEGRVDINNTSKIRTIIKY